MDISKVRDEIHKVTERCCVMIELEEKKWKLMYAQSIC